MCASMGSSHCLTIEPSPVLRRWWGRLLYPADYPYPGFQPTTAKPSSDPKQLLPVRKYRLCSLPYLHHPRQIPGPMRNPLNHRSLDSRHIHPGPGDWKEKGFAPSQWYRVAKTERLIWKKLGREMEQRSDSGTWVNHCYSLLGVRSSLSFGFLSQVLDILQGNPHCWEQFLLEKRPKHRGGKGVDELNRNYQWTLKRRSKDYKVFFKTLKRNKKHSLSSDIQTHLRRQYIWSQFSTVSEVLICPVGPRSLSWYLPDELKLLCVLHY